MKRNPSYSDAPFSRELTRAVIRAVRANGGVCPDCGRTIPRDKEAERLHAEGLPEDHCQLRPDVADRL